MNKLLMDAMLGVALQTKIESVIKWLDMGLSVEQIAKGEDLEVRHVIEIAKTKEEFEAWKRENNPFLRCRKNKGD